MDHLGVGRLGVGAAIEERVHQQDNDGDEQKKAQLQPRWWYLKWMPRPFGSADGRRTPA
jgi:hypothetical protein